PLSNSWASPQPLSRVIGPIVHQPPSIASNSLQARIETAKRKARQDVTATHWPPERARSAFHHTGDLVLRPSYGPLAGCPLNNLRHHVGQDIGVLDLRHILIRWGGPARWMGVFTFFGEEGHLRVIGPNGVILEVPHWRMVKAIARDDPGG